VHDDHQILTQQYITILYHKIAKHSILAVNKQSKKTETHGEILYEGVSKILSHLTVAEQDKFVDLGSGLGKTVVQFFLMTHVKEAMGIEVVTNLHRLALSAAEHIQKNLPIFFNHERKLIFNSINYRLC
jgi:hypothetical protein